MPNAALKWSVSAAELIFLQTLAKIKRLESLVLLWNPALAPAPAKFATRKLAKSGSGWIWKENPVQA